MSSDVFGDLVAAVRDAAAAPAAELSDGQVKDELVALRQLADAAEAAYLTRLRTFDQRRISEVESALSTRGWVRHEMHVAPAETSRLLKVARRLIDLPLIEAALMAGEIRIPHAAAIADAATLLGVDVIAGCQDALVEAARMDDPTRIRAALRGLGAAVDNDKAVKRAEKRDQGRWLDISATFDGAVVIDGVLPGSDEAGGIVQAAIDSLAAPAGADDARTPSQRRADALVELCRRQLASGNLPTRGGEPAHVNVTVPLDTLEARTGGFGESGDGTVLRGETVRRLACDAKITRIITDAGSQPLDVGRTQRTVTAAQRKALRLRDQGCRFPGCDRPAEWTDAHHVVHWAHGGPTDLDNMILLCRKHHTAVHEGGWSITTSASGQFRFIDPNGQLAPDDPPHSVSDIVTGLVNTINQPSRAGPVGREHACAESTAPGATGDRPSAGRPSASRPGPGRPSASRTSAGAPEVHSTDGHTDVEPDAA